MVPTDFNESNKTFMPPTSMPNGEHCVQLHVAASGAVNTSCWRPSFMERLTLMTGGRIWLHVMSGKTHPPVAITVQRNYFNFSLADRVRNYLRGIRYDIVSYFKRDREA